MPEPLLALGLLLTLPQTMPTGKKYSGFRKGIFTSSQPLAVIDSGHLNGFSKDLWERNSIGGLAMNLAREGYLPIVTGEACAKTDPAESLRVLIEPRRPIPPAETTMLLISGAWAVQAEESPEVQVHYRAWGIPIVVTRKMNKGHLTLIADPEFLMDRTLEAENDYWEGNLTLFRTLLHQRRRE